MVKYVEQRINAHLTVEYFKMKTEAPQTYLIKTQMQ